MYNVGDFVNFKPFSGRGRPMKAEVVKNLGIFLLLRTRDGNEQRILKNKILGHHEYNWTRRKAA